MNHIYNYIIKISNELNDTFKTESGLELYGSKQFSHNRLANRYATIVGQPLIFDGQILEVDENWMITKNKIGEAKFMHCLPVRRNVVVEDAVLDSDNSIVIQQANNRTFAAQLVLKKILES